MNIKEISKELTRKEFIEILDDSDRFKFEYNDFECECPSGLGILEHCEFNTCKDCWLESIKNIKFKGENGMNKREELETLLKEKREIQKTINQEVQKIIDEIRELPLTNFEVEEEKDSYFIDVTGKIYKIISRKSILKNYNTFTNTKYAEKVAYKQWFERKLLAYKEEYGDKCDWDDKNEMKYSVYTDFETIKIDSCKYYKDSGIFFNSRELLQKHIEENKQEWINYFNVCKELD